MTNFSGIFSDEWRDCLRAHYMHVVRIRDRVTEPSLTIVMHQAGFTDSELAELRVRATMHVDDVGADFVPDLDVLESDQPDQPRIFPAAERPLSVETGDEQENSEPDALPPQDDETDPDAPVQLTLF